MREAAEILHMIQSVNRSNIEASSAIILAPSKEIATMIEEITDSLVTALYFDNATTFDEEIDRLVNDTINHVGKCRFSAETN